MGGKGIGRDVNIIEIHLSVLEPGIAILDIGSTGTQGLDLRPGEYDSGLHGLVNMIVMVRLFIFADYFHGVKITIEWKVGKGGEKKIRWNIEKKTLAILNV